MEGDLPPPAKLVRVASNTSSNVRRKDLKQTNLKPLPYGSVIHITSHSVDLDLAKPWKVGSPRTGTGTGFHIGGKHILTNSHVIHNHTSIRLERHGQPGNFAAKLLCESIVCDLALLTVEDPCFWVGLPAVRFQESVPELDDTVVAVGYPLGARSVTVTRGVVSNVQMTDLSLKKRHPMQLQVQVHMCDVCGRLVVV